MAQTTVKSEQIATNAISGTIIADNAITGVHIAQNAILTQHIDDGQVNTDQLAADAVTGAKLADSSVVTANIQDDQVTSDKLANNITIAGTLASTGVLTANAGVVVDNITIDGTEIDLSSGDLTLDVAGDIILDADGGDIWFKDGGTAIGQFRHASSSFIIKSNVTDNDLILRGDDGGSAIDALTFDMSDAGKATFNSGVVTGGPLTLGDYIEKTSGNLTIDVAGDIILDADGGDFYVKDGGTTLLHLDQYYRLGLGGDAVAKLDIHYDSGGFDDSDANSRLASSMMHFQGDNDMRLIFTENGSTFRGMLGYEHAGSSYMGIWDSGSSATPSLISQGGKIGIGTTSPSQLLHVSSTGSAGILLEADSDNANEDHVGEIQITQDGGATYHKLGTNNDNHAYINVSEALIIERQGTEKIRMDNAGKLFIGDSTFGGTAARFAVEVPASGAGCLIRVDSAANANETLLQFQDAAGQALGSITGNPSSNTTAYGTSSDYRLKENVSYTWDATTRLKQLKPARFNWKSQDESTVQDGFLAHEVSAIVPSAIVGAKDAKDSDDNPIYQQIDHSKLVPLLVKTIQELEARIKTLEDA